MRDASDSGRILNVTCRARQSVMPPIEAGLYSIGIDVPFATRISIAPTSALAILSFSRVSFMRCQASLHLPAESARSPDRIPKLQSGLLRRRRNFNRPHDSGDISHIAGENHGLVWAVGMADHSPTRAKGFACPRSGDDPPKLPDSRGPRRELSPFFFVLPLFIDPPSSNIVTLPRSDVAIASRVSLPIIPARAGGRGGSLPSGHAVAMDLRTIMNDAGGASNAPPATQASSSPTDPSHPQRAQQQYSEYSGHPSQPSLQHTHASPDRSSSFGPAQSPYQQFNAPPPLNTALQSQQSQSPTLVSTPDGHSARDPYGASAYNSHPQAPAGPLASPYTPQHPMTAGPQHPEQQSYFAQQRSHSLQSMMTTPRAPGEIFRPRDSPPSASQPLPPHQFSPSARRSVPGTPLGPPPAFSSRQSPSSARPESSGRDSPRNTLSSPHGIHEAQGRDMRQRKSPSTSRQLSPSSRPYESTPQLHSAHVKQEPSENSSPKVVSRQNSTAATSDTAGAAPFAHPKTEGGTRVPQHHFHRGQAPRSGSHPLKMEIDHEAMGHAENQPPRSKRRRYNEPPIYAQRSVRTKGRCPVIPNPQPPIPRHARGANQDSWASRRQSLASAAGSTTTTRTARTPGAVVLPPSANGPRAPRTPQEGSLGPWEPSITGFIPYEEITKQLCDFLFQHVVIRNDVAAGPAGSAAAGQGAIIEIEAKLGHVIDMDRRERLQLPILTESVINRESRVRTSFESTMTVDQTDHETFQEQHRAMNNFLNEQVKASMSNESPRIPISYAHKKERDTFYEVSPQDLPPPRTNVDWRVSVNLEMEYDGDVSTLPMVDVAKGGRGERIKDRMSYRHLAYQIDLTQVARAEASAKNEFEHELEVEISAAEIQRQGNLAMAGDPQNQYEELVKGFVDNIRVLARAVPP
ncbi:uncharacterized protein N7482_001043 [Penicillium canariense]|uniref:mRNA-capping enzyme subunit beta n=1 Tax=Penicillium canariense TaxID=189055 RepID=A0A9W9IJ12_9EURO|nr:uncharacterized protein N7482_001043 [Penicillium canariense]KAJ5175166.1 hypothetical protein N7482_001043 [Penicillium canariense]